MGRLEGKVAIITGAGAGMGRAAAILFAKEGAKVVVAELVAEAGKETVKMIKEAGGEAIFVTTDVAKAESVKNMVRAAVNTYGKLDVLFNNAGILGDLASTVDLTEENYDKVMAINLKGVWLGMKYAIPEMLKSGGGSIINTASISAMVGVRGTPQYSASKGGVVALSKVAAMEYASKKVRVNIINPAAIRTELTAELERRDPILYKQIESLVPLGRFAKAEEVAWLALFLASDESSFMIGSELVIDGGSSASCLWHLI